MYRYLLKYVGTYRVKAEYDETCNDFPRDADGSIDESFEDLYIPCKKGIIKHTYKGQDILALCFFDKIITANRVREEIIKKYPKMEIEFEDDGSDAYIYFNAKDIKKIATIVTPRTSGAKINPFSNKNLPKIEYKIPSKDLADLYSITKDLDRYQTMHFYKTVNEKFIKSIGKKKARTQSRLSSKEFIHSIGMWERYLKFARKEYDKSLGKK